MTVFFNYNFMKLNLSADYCISVAETLADQPKMYYLCNVKRKRPVITLNHTVN